MNFKDEKARLLEEAIVRTIAFFDLFDYPLTDFEVWKFLHANVETHRNASLREIKNVLKGVLGGSTASKAVEPLIKTKNGFYFLKGREEIIRTRLERYNFTDRKFKRALRVAKIYRSLPWVKMIAVANIIGAHNLKDESDIDFFIITAKGKIWLTRFFSAGLAKILGLRPSEKNSRDKICLNFYVSEEDMNLKKFTLEENDIYFIYWLANLIPIYEKDDMYKKFIQVNGWLKSYLPNWQEAKMVDRRFVKERKNLFFYFLFNFIFGSLENLFKKIQLQKLPTKFKELMNKDTRVVVTDRVLKLHEKDRRQKYKRMWEDRIRELNI